MLCTATFIKSKAINSYSLCKIIRIAESYFIWSIRSMTTIEIQFQAGGLEGNHVDSYFGGSTLSKSNTGKRQSQYI